MPSYIRTRTEFAVNSFTSGNQMAPSVSTFDDGGFVVVWGTSDPTQDGSSSALKAQLFDASGSKVGMEFLVNEDASGYQFTASTTALGGGRFVVTWVTSGSEDGTDGIRARLFDRYGSPIGGEFAVNMTASVSLFTPNVAKLANGGFVISWDGGFDIKAQIYDMAGLPVGGEFRLNSNADYGQEYGDIVGLAGGGFVATWRTTDTIADGSGEAVKAQVFSATGAKVGAEFLVNSQKAGAQNSPTIAALSGGGFVITWYNADSAQDGSGSAIKAQLFNASGAKLGAEVLVNSQTADAQTEPAVTATPDGGFVIAWTTRHSAQDGSGSAIKAQSFDSAGAKVGAEMLVNSLATGSQFGADLATLADGRVIVAWQSESGDIDGHSVRAQILGTSLAAPLPNMRPIIISNGGGTSVTIVQDEGEMAITTVVASDDGEPNNLRYSLSPGGDSALFRIDPFTGVLSWAQPPQFDPNGSNFHSVTVNASDGELSGFQTIQLSVSHVNHVTIVSDGGYDWAQISADENQSAVTVVSAIDDDGAALTYSITGGEDAAFFTIDAQTGELSFISAPDYEQPEDHWGDNFYEVEVTATDGTRSDSQFIGVVVEDVEEAPGFAITSDGGGDHAELHRPENSLAVTVVTVAGAAGPVTYEIVGGVSASWFDIDPGTGALAFRGPPDFETGPYGPGPGTYPYNEPFPYGVIVRASDGTSFDEQQIVIWLDDVDEAPIFESFDGADQVGMIVSENDVDLGYVWASDPDRYSWVTYGVDGPDAAFFQVDPYSGAFSFILAPDFEAWADADADNVYEVSVVAYSGMLSASQSFSFTVVDLWEYSNERPTIVSNGGGTSASVDMDERQTLVTTVFAVDDGGPNPVHYSITGGWAAALFAIDSVTGELFFREAPDYENPAEGSDNSYSVEVTADDGELWTSQLIQVTVTNVYEDVRFDSPSSAFSIDENLLAVGAVPARGEEGATLHYAIMAGGDGDFFLIDGDTGELSFWAAPNFEIAQDMGWDNVYNLTVSVTDGTTSAVQSVSVTVGDIDEGIEIISYGGAASVALTKGENVSWVGQVQAGDEDGAEITYSIAGGADAALFQVDPVTGELTFRYEARPDFEDPTDSDGDSVYEVTVAASGDEFSATQAFSVTIANNNEGVWITSNGGDWRADITIAENSSAVTTVTAFDPDGTVPIFQIVGGADAARFTIDAQTGALSFIVAPDYETWADSDGDNVYNVMVAANDGDFATAQDIFVAVAEVDEPVEIVSYGGASSVSLTMVEEYYIVGQVAAEDDGFGTFDPIVFTITGGADAGLFTVDRYSGRLNFVYDLAPDFENPSDADGDNVYDVVVTASTFTSSDTQAFAINVVNRNEGIWITSPGWWQTIIVAENGHAVATVVAEDPDGTVPTYSIAGGADAARFTIDAQTGALSFIVAPDYEAPADVGANNVYNVTVAASDGEITTWQDLSIRVGDVDDTVRIVSYGAADIAIRDVAEGETAAAQLEAVSPNGGPVTYSITGGDDAALFAIDSATGALRFIAAPDFELPGNVDGNNTYMVTVTASDGVSSDTQIFGLGIVNVNEAVAITSGGGGASASVQANENQLAVTTIVAEDHDETFPAFAIVGGADAARFTIDAVSGVLRFVSAPDREAPGDAGGDNVYDVVVRATDGSLFDDQALAVTVANVDEGLAVTSFGGIDIVQLSRTENGSAVAQVAAVDTEGDPVTYLIVGGLDADKFRLDPVTGALTFAAAPNFEAPADSNLDNVYKVEVAAVSGAFTDTQAFSVTVTNANEVLAITSNGGGGIAAVSIGENSRAVTNVAAVDPDGTAATYSILGGSDAARFTINPQTGLLEFVAAPDHEAPSDYNGDNVYTVMVGASDGQYTVFQTLNVSIANLRDGNNVTGTTGGDSISGTSTNPALRTTNAEDTVSGRDGHDTILGLAGADWLNGDAGNDVLNGGAGADRLTGGLGKDQFVYNDLTESTPTVRDVITDFSPSQNDKISLSGIDANIWLSGNQAFTFIGAAAFSGAAGQLRYATSGGVTLVSGDINGDGVADFQIELTGTLTPVASDFVL